MCRAVVARLARSADSRPDSSQSDARRNTTVYGHSFCEWLVAVTAVVCANHPTSNIYLYIFVMNHFGGGSSRVATNI